MACDEAYKKGGVASRTAIVFCNNLFSDVKFIVGPQKVVYPAHKLLLSLASPVFAEHFYEDGSSANSVTTVEFLDKNPETVQKLLKFVYTDDLKFASVIEANEVLELATTYDIPELQLLCQEYIEKTDIDVDKVCQMYESAMVLEMDRVIELCQRTFKRCTKEVLQSEGFLNANLITLEAILDNDVLQVENEMEILQAVVNWGTKECSRRSCPVDSANIRRAIFPLLKHIRFLTLSEKEYDHFVDEHDGLLTMQEGIRIMKAIIRHDDNAELPSFICNKTAKRKPFNNQTVYLFSENVEAEANKLNDLNVTPLGKIKDNVKENPCRILLKGCISSNIDPTDLSPGNKSSSNMPESAIDRILQPRILQSNTVAIRNMATMSSSYHHVSLKDNIKLNEEALTMMNAFSNSGMSQNMENRNDIFHMNQVSLQGSKAKFNTTALSIMENKKKYELPNISQVNEAKSISKSNNNSSDDSSSSDDETQQTTDDLIILDPVCQSCNFVLENEEISRDFQNVDMISNVSLEVQAGTVRVIGLVLKLKQATPKKEIIRFILNVKDCPEQVVEEDISKPVHVRFSRSLRIEKGETATIKVTVESIELKKCFICSTSILPLWAGSCKFKVFASGNHKSRPGSLPCFAFAINQILFYAQN